VDQEEIKSVPIFQSICVLDSSSRYIINKKEYTVGTIKLEEKGLMLLQMNVPGYPGPAYLFF